MNSSILERYKLAQEIMQGSLTNSLVKNDTVFPHWVDSGDNFWYVRTTHGGKEFRLVNTNSASNCPAFDHKALAHLLAITSGEQVDHQDLPISNLTISLSPKLVRFHALRKCWLYNPDECIWQEDFMIQEEVGTLVSPDERSAVFVRDYNLWLRDLVNNDERALTHDGTPDYCYGLSFIDRYTGASSSKDISVQALWSPDSKHLLTHCLDVRHVEDLPSVQYASHNGSLRPEIYHRKFAYPGDDNIEAYQLMAIDIKTGEISIAQYDSLPLWAKGDGFFSDDNLAWWSPDCRRSFFIEVTRGAKAVRVVEFDTHSGGTRVLFEEVSETFIKLCHGVYSKPLFIPLPETDELVWFSERTGWGHLYLYDLTSGNLKKTLTDGNWLVRDVLHYSRELREILIQTGARDSDVCPYYRDICKLNIDSGQLTPLIIGNYDHFVQRPTELSVFLRNMLGIDSDDISGISPNGDYIVTTYSRVDTSPVTVLIDRAGNQILTIENTDITNLPAGWRWPEPVKLKAADQETDIYGVVFRPVNFTPDECYPVLDFSCSLRSATFIPQGSFINGTCYDFFYLMGVALASLGFIVVAIEGRGTPNREKSFQDYNYGEVTSICDLTDRISGLRQLAEKYSYMDLERVGISGGDNLASPVYGLIDHPDFYKVAVAHCFYEPRFYSASMGERHEDFAIGDLPLSNARYAENRVQSMKGKLLLIQGMLDSTSAAGTFRLVKAMFDANKDFDMLCLPNFGHQLTGYTLRRNWDYLVEHLLGAEPPKEFKLTLSEELDLS